MSATIIVSFQAKPDQVESLLAFLSGLQAGILEAAEQAAFGQRLLLSSSLKRNT